MINFTPILFSPEVIISIPRHKNIEKILIELKVESGKQCGTCREQITFWLEEKLTLYTHK